LGRAHQLYNGSGAVGGSGSTFSGAVDTALANYTNFLTALTTPVPDAVAAAGPWATMVSRTLTATGTDTSAVNGRGRRLRRTYRKCRWAIDVVGCWLRWQ
jgi:hypothetical protein